MRRRGHWQAGFAQRFGAYDTKLKQAITNRHVLWIHAVSVGEVEPLHPAHPRARTPHAQPQDRGLHHHHHRHGRTAAQAALAHQQDLLSD
ncbi:MAG: hypothetical protein M0C28_13685 [Candidatus Moduliflexus flocculans]|nr:hypothetical protein [Candidatus Moduliflexus flocculans]